MKMKVALGGQLIKVGRSYNTLRGAMLAYEHIVGKEDVEVCR
jgi:hypothetical protein